ncbi:UDP-2,4-diacetamido-2,4,6-trideoxy-beta-L-altropyranose hydrolase [Reinekea forsetii]|uniref:Surface polysaccharide biosynthesis protein / glycosyltransferase, GT28 family n=1 Tax=Reinekea forsetii TaxID=1336806 RepID=A0A2K8KR93_9GAMM|nr:UDP-2,4-diacetamido-2,4,6-trideoxy-beta-L-altropyranose hydrolase [Reinekea forsetii]ATX76599.1 surface polysaccharide biosynthesis protein / glycosyltransferase, GT28 family [Reinekea forsetii]
MLMNIIFRTDASLDIGTGHVMRCLTLAQALRAQGASCRFICRPHEGNLLELIRKRGFEAQALATQVVMQEKLTEKYESVPAHAASLGVDWKTDAEQTKNLIGDVVVDWLIVDHYAIDKNWQLLLENCYHKLMVIDDLGDRDHQADILLDQNAQGKSGEARYKGRTNAECNLLLGPHYALLGLDYPLLANALPERNGEISRVLIFVGGSDPFHLTERYLTALNAPEFRHLYVDVVIGSNHSAPEAVSDLVSRVEHARVYYELPSLSALIIRADLMLGAGGATNWERMCLGLNSVIVSVAINQHGINQELEKKGLIYFLGKVEHANINLIRAGLKQILVNPSGNRVSSKRMRELVDGNGCRRVVQALIDQRNI